MQSGQRVILFLNELNNTTDPRSYSFQLPASTPLPASALSIDIKEVKIANYLIRVQVDGAENPVNSDASGKYNFPSVTIP